MKRIVTLFGIFGILAMATASNAAAQGSGTLQATAQVVDTRETWSDLNSARTLFSSLEDSHPVVSTTLARISMIVPEPFTEQRKSPRLALVTISYVRN